MPIRKTTITLPRDFEPLIPTYLKNRQNDIEMLTQAFKSGDYKSIQHLGHRMNGNGSAYGFDTITHIGKKIETAIQHGAIDEISLYLSELQDYLDGLTVEYE